MEQKSSQKMTAPTKYLLQNDWGSRAQIELFDLKKSRDRGPI
jgi:hypothetical protein